MSNRLRSVVVLVPFFLLMASCGDGDGTETPTGPGADVTGLRVPEDFPTLYDALAAATTADTISLAAGRYTVDASIDRGVAIRGRTGDPADVVLLDSRLVVRASAGQHVTLQDVGLRGGDTLVTLQSDADLTLTGCHLAVAELGILHAGAGGLSLRDCDLDTLGAAGAVVVSGGGTIDWSGGQVRRCRATQAVLDLQPGARGVLTGVTFLEGPRYGIRHRGADLTLTDCTFRDALGPGLVVAPGARATLTGCRFTAGIWPAVEVGGMLTAETTVVAWGQGPAAAMQVSSPGRVSLARVTIHDGDAPALELADGAEVSLAASLLTAVAVPMVAWSGSSATSLAVDRVDAWVPGQSAWAGLEGVREAGQDNREVDPLYCGDDDLRLQDQTPVPGWGGLPVGCVDRVQPPRWNELKKSWTSVRSNRSGAAPSAVSR